MSWGKGGIVGINAAIHRHQRTLDAAALILEAEHGTRHNPGERDDLCPLCQKEKAEKAKEKK